MLARRGLHKASGQTPREFVAAIPQDALAAPGAQPDLAEEVVHLAIYLASDESRWTNGAALVIDGGITVNYF